MTDSLSFFKSFIQTDENNKSTATDVLSLDCYSHWLDTFGVSSLTPEEDFSKHLLSHVQGSNGKKPFLKSEENAIITELNKQRIWPCFKTTKSNIGKHGIYPIGFHNKQQISVETRRLRSSKRKAIINNKQGLIEETKEEFGVLVRQKGKNKYLSSYEVFLKFTDEDATGCSRILSKECFQTWVKTRRHGVKNAEHSFRKALIAHLCGKDGRRPFPPSIEPSVVAAIRKKRVWPCFVGNKDPRILNIGNKGFRHLAYHEGKLAEADGTSEIEKVDVKAKQARKSVRRSASAYEMSTSTKFSPKRRKMTKSHSMVMSGESDFFNAGKVDVKLERTYSEAELIFEPIGGQFEVNEKDYVCWDISSFDSNEFYLTNFFESKLADDTQNILTNFEGVTQEEILKVNSIKERTSTIFDDYFLKVEREYGISLNSTNALDICGDVKILQFLRVAENNVSKTVTLIEQYLKWREEHNLEEIRIQLIRDDPTIQDIKEKFVLGRFGGCQPFAKQLSNGDFLELWQLQPNTCQMVELMRERVQDHILLNEYRNLVLNKLSYQSNRLVQYTILWDCCVIRSDNSCENSNCSKHFNWLRTLKDLKYYIDSVNDLTWKWYAGNCKQVYAFGKGYLFRALSMLVFKTILSKYAMDRIEIIGQPEENKELIEQILETSVDFKQNVFTKENSKLSKQCLSVLSSATVTRQL